jgi:hypothetical protein
VIDPAGWDAWLELYVEQNIQLQNAVFRPVSSRLSQESATVT